MAKQTVYAVQYKNFEYDDQYNNPTDGVDECMDLFSSLEDAKRHAFQMNFDFYHDNDICDYSEDPSWFFSEKLEEYMKQNNIDSFELSEHFKNSPVDVQNFIMAECSLTYASVKKLELNV